MILWIERVLLPVGRFIQMQDGKKQQDILYGMVPGNEATQVSHWSPGV